MILNKAMSRCLLLGLALMLGACTQTYTTSDGTRKTTNVPKILIDADDTIEEVNAQLLQIGTVPEKYRNAIRVEAVSGFKQNPFAFANPTPINDQEAKSLFADMIENAKGGPGDRYRLTIEMLGPHTPPSMGTVTTTTKIAYSLVDSSGREVFRTTQQAPFRVSFSSVPYGDLRFRLAFSGSLNNNFAKFVSALK